MIRNTLFICCTLLLGLSVSGCVLSTQWSDNFALASTGAEATDPALNDGKLDTIATAWMKDQKRVFALKFPTPKRVRKIIIHNQNLFRFNVEYWDNDAWEWKRISEVRQRRNIETGRAQPQYVIDRINFETTMIRIDITRTVDDRVVSKMSVGPNDKIVNQIRDNIAGRYVEYYRVLVPAEASIKEVEVFDVLPEEKRAGSAK